MDVPAGDEARGRPREIGPVGEPVAPGPGPGLDMSGAVTAADPALGERAIDRSHNRDILSSEAMTEMLRDLQDSLAAAEERVATLETARGRLSAESRALALGVAGLGDTLSRRVRALETGRPAMATVPVPALAPAAPPPVPRKPEPTLRWTLGLALALAAVLAAFWLLGGEIGDGAAAARRAPPPAPAPLAVAVPSTVSTLTRAASGKGASPLPPVVHHGSRTPAARTRRAAPASDAPSPPAFHSYGAAAPAPTP